MAFHVSYLEGSTPSQHKETDAQLLKNHITSIVKKLSQDIEAARSKEHFLSSSSAALAHGPSSTKIGSGGSKALTMATTVQLNSDFFLV